MIGPGTGLPFRLWILAAGLIAGLSLPALPSDQVVAGTYRNPLKPGPGADPWLMVHDGRYHLATTTGRDVRLRAATRLADLAAAPDVVVWRDSAPGRNRDVWAPEFHRLDARDGRGPRWFLYVTASDGVDDAHHRMFVAEGDADDPMKPYTTKAKLRTDPDDAQYAIDGTVMKRPDGSLYFIWCGRPSPAGQGLYLSRMTDPWTLEGPRVDLDADGFGCDVVREGPVALRRQDGGAETFLVYSACGADTPDYRLGMLILDDDTADPLAPNAWRQHPTPILTRDDDRGVFGPGHCSFFRSPDGREDWIAYHAKSLTRRGYADRATHAQRIGWSPDGLPVLGRPAPTGVDLPAPSGEPAPTAIPNPD
jgi:GH43 family beta-xylosidase